MVVGGCIFTKDYWRDGSEQNRHISNVDNEKAFHRMLIEEEENCSPKDGCTWTESGLFAECVCVDLRSEEEKAKQMEEDSKIECEALGGEYDYNSGGCVVD